jgi:uncharacterized protein
MDRHDTAALASRAAVVIAACDAVVPSPCVSVCKMDADRRYCIGCLRTIPEIAGWSKMDDAARRDIWRAIQLRLHSPLDTEATP